MARVMRKSTVIANRSPVANAFIRRRANRRAASSRADAGAGLDTVLAVLTPARSAHRSAMAVRLVLVEQEGAVGRGLARRFGARLVGPAVGPLVDGLVGYRGALVGGTVRWRRARGRPIVARLRRRLRDQGAGDD